MIRAISLLLAVAPLAGLIGAPAAAQAIAPVDIRTSKLADGIYQFTIAADGYVENLNSVAIISDVDVVVFDTTTRPSSARRILAEIRKLTNKPVTTVVNSHWHPDHWSGNEVFAEANPNLQIIATEQERDFMLNMSSMWPAIMPVGLANAEKQVADLFAAGKDEAGTPLTPQSRAKLQNELQLIRDRVAEQLKVKRTYPNVTYSDRMVIRRGGREIHLISVTGDAAGTTVMHLPKERILATGDAVSHPLPYYTPPLSEHARSLRMLAELDADIVIPGHGPAFRDKAYMLLEAELFEAVVDRVQQALRNGAVTIDDVQKAVKLDDLRDRFATGDPEIARQFPLFTGGMIRRAFIEVRDTKEIR